MRLLNASTYNPAVRRSHISSVPRVSAGSISRPVVRTSSSEHDAASTSQPQGYTSVPFSELPQPNPAANKTLLKAKGMGNQTGADKALLDSLGSVSFTLVGDDPALSWAVAQELSKRIGWFPVSTLKILAGMNKVDQSGSFPQLEEALSKTLGQGALAQEEAKVLAGLRNQWRTVRCTSGTGAAMQQATYRDLWGSFIVWIDEEDKAKPKPNSPQRVLLASQAEIVVALKKSRGFARAKETVEDKAKDAIEVLMAKLVNLLNEKKDVVERKTKYVAYGCRGDWPVVQPAEWNHLLDRTPERPPTAPESSVPSA